MIAMETGTDRLLIEDGMSRFLLENEAAIIVNFVHLANIKGTAPRLDHQSSGSKPVLSATRGRSPVLVSVGATVST